MLLTQLEVAQAQVHMEPNTTLELFVRRWSNVYWTHPLELVQSHHWHLACPLRFLLVPHLLRYD
jgi:hypothetical protein